MRTTHLQLRPFTREDTTSYANILRKPEVVEFLPNEQDTNQADKTAETMITFWLTGQKEDGYAPWAVIHQETGTLIGHVGFRKSEEFRSPELLYMFDSNFWGRGYATEAVRAACNIAQKQLSLPYVMAVALRSNIGSIAVMKKCGFKFEANLQDGGFQLVRYGLTF
ncbi:GNAT family N-acetyltransferase [Kordiimonas laminariae]|uniref:GNAT family N-acetyltransferase n=1 Tax=Kordiimonas laminariae TaxID=2917717 RepID=UPI001FF54A66|nr:GNAT family N-acetyltransferase [Kordiimonas laminariae]MCK0070590.1 GNAT family N-acetyltransferase [Kordiimonas laminariae]